MDYSNGSYFKSLQINASKAFTFGDYLKITCGAVVANMWGSNILKNDMFFRNLCLWPGSRTKNYTSLRTSIHLINYPYLKAFSWHPYIYGQVWNTFFPNEVNSYDTKMEVDYGIGFTTSD